MIDELKEFGTTMWVSLVALVTAYGTGFLMVWLRNIFDKFLKKKNIAKEAAEREAEKLAEAQKRAEEYAEFEEKLMCNMATMVSAAIEDIIKPYADQLQISTQEICELKKTVKKNTEAITHIKE